MVASAGDTSFGGLVRTFLKDSSVYSIGIAFGKMTSFLVLPILTARLTPADFGTLKLLQVFSGILAIFLNAGVQQAINRIYFDDSSEEHKREVVGTGLLWRLVLTTVLLGGLALMATPVTRLLLGDATSDSILYVQFTLLNLAILAPQGIAYNLYRLRMQAARNSMLSVSGGLIYIVVLVVFVVALTRGIRGVFEASIVANLLMTLILLPNLLRSSKLGIRKDVLRGIITYGAPFLPHQLAGYLLFGADRYFLEAFGTRTDVGLYSYAYSIGMAMTLVLDGAGMAWTPYVFSIQKRDDARRLHATTARYVLAVIASMAVLLTAFAPELVYLLASSRPEFWVVSSLVPLFVLGYTFLGAYQVFGTAVNIPKKPIYLLLYTSSGMVTNIGLNWLLVPRYGMMGAAVASVIAYSVMGILAVIVTQRVHYIPYEWRRLGVLALCAVAAGSVALIIPQTLSVPTGLAIKGSLALSFPLALYALGFFTVEEKAALARILEAVIGRGRFWK
jgi:O-antigen/teichoic acid export membrane protein